MYFGIIYKENATLQHFRNHFANCSNRSCKECVDEARSRKDEKKKNKELALCVCVCVCVDTYGGDKKTGVETCNIRGHCSFLQIGERKSLVSQNRSAKLLLTLNPIKSFLSTVCVTYLLSNKTSCPDWHFQWLADSPASSDVNIFAHKAKAYYGVPNNICLDIDYYNASSVLHLWYF